MGQAHGLRRPLRPPARHWTRHIAPGYRVAFNVSLDAPELITVANQRIIALVLPKRLAAPLEQQVGSFRGGRLGRAWKLRSARLRSEEEMDAMGHEHPRVQLVVPDFRSILDRSRDELRHGRLSEKGGDAASAIEPAVHRDEGFARSRISRPERGAVPEDCRASGR